jgi:hypothetical protein
MVEFMQINVDASDAIEGMRNLEGNLSRAGKQAMSRAVHIIRSRIPRIMMETYEAALGVAGDFPPIYANHLRQGLRTIVPRISFDEDELVIDIGDIEGLGDVSDLEEAVHYHAILMYGDPSEFSISNPALSDIGTDESALYGPNKPSGGEDRRQEFWEALVQGHDFIIQFGGANNAWTGVISTTGMFDETLNARVALWGNRYPEWILLDEGMEGVPTVLPTHFVELTHDAIEEYARLVIDSVFVETLEEAISDEPVRSISTPKATDIYYNPKSKRWHGPRGFVPAPTND